MFIAFNLDISSVQTRRRNMVAHEAVKPYPVLEEMEENAFDYESADRDLQYVFINAQTGKVCDPNTVGTEKYNVPQIIE